MDGRQKVKNMDIEETIEYIKKINDLANKILEINCELIYKNIQTIIQLEKIKTGNQTQQQDKTDNTTTTDTQ